MTTSATRPTTTPDSGFSLVEMLVVLAIIGLAASVVMLTGPSSTHSLAREADRLAAHIAAARDLALVRNRPVRIDLTEDAYQTLAGGRAGWTLQGDPQLWIDGTSLAHSSGRMPAIIQFDTVGLSEDASVTLYRNGAAETVHIDGAGNITREASRAR